MKVARVAVLVCVLTSAFGRVLRECSLRLATFRDENSRTISLGIEFLKVAGSKEVPRRRKATKEEGERKEKRPAARTLSP